MTNPRKNPQVTPEFTQTVTLVVHDQDELHMTVQEAEAEAARLLDTSWWSLGRDLPIDPSYLARQLGIAVRFEPLPLDESGNIVIAPDVEPVITLNANDHPNRQRFTCAHEIGHYRRRKMEAVTQRFVDNRDTLAGLGTDVDEIFANQFAAALLMPARRVQEFFQLKNLRADEMGILFGTSAQAIEIRLRNLRLT